MKVLLFDFKKFIYQKLPNGERLNLEPKVVREFKKLDGSRIYSFNKRSFSKRILGLTHYMQIGDEKIAVGEEFGTWKTIT